MALRLEDFQVAAEAHPGASRLVLKKTEGEKISLEPQQSSLSGRVIKWMKGSEGSEKNKAIVEAFKEAIRTDIRIDNHAQLLNDFKKHLTECQKKGLSAYDIKRVLDGLILLPSATLIDSPEVGIPLTEQEDWAEDALEDMIDFSRAELEIQNFIQSTLSGRTASLANVEAFIAENKDRPPMAEKISINDQQVMAPPVTSEPIQARSLLHEQNIQQYQGRPYIVAEASSAASASSAPAARAQLISNFDRCAEEAYQKANRPVPKLLTTEEVNIEQREIALDQARDLFRARRNAVPESAQESSSGIQAASSIESQPAPIIKQTASSKSWFSIFKINIKFSKLSSFFSYRPSKQKMQPMTGNMVEIAPSDKKSSSIFQRFRFSNPFWAHATPPAPIP